MNKRVFIRLGRLIFLAGLFSLAGCSTPSEDTAPGSDTRVAKERGVYTTIAMSGAQLDMPASGYASCQTFGPGQTPAAVVLGTGAAVSENFNASQLYKLQLIETASGVVMQNLSGEVDSGKADIYDLPIRKSGSYRLNLLVNGAVYDTWDFTVIRNDSGDNHPGGSQLTAYAKGNFSVSIEPAPATDAFAHYDEVLILALNDAIGREVKHANPDDFAQVPRGHVTIQFDLGASGQVIAPKILESTLTEALGQFFIRALQNGAPYQTWPAAAQTAIGKDTRLVKVTFYYD